MWAYLASRIDSGVESEPREDEPSLSDAAMASIDIPLLLASIISFLRPLKPMLFVPLAHLPRLTPAP